MAVCQCVTLRGNPGLCDVDHLFPSCLSTDGNSRISTIRATADRVSQDNLIQQKNNSEKETGIYVNKTALIPGSQQGENKSILLSTETAKHLKKFKRRTQGRFQTLLLLFPF